MELVKLYPDSVQLESWISVQESLQARGITPVSSDRKWIEASISELKEQCCLVQTAQRKLADERRSEEQASLHRFYEDIRSRAQLRWPGSGGPDDLHGLGAGGYPHKRTSLLPKAEEMSLASSGDEDS